MITLCTLKGVHMNKNYARNQRRENSDYRYGDRDTEKTAYREYGLDENQMNESNNHNPSQFRNREDYSLGTGTSMSSRAYNSFDDYSQSPTDRYREGADSNYFMEEESYSSSNRGGYYGKGPKGYKRNDERIKEDAC